MKLLKTIKFDEVNPEELEKYEFRQTARAIVFDKEGKIALLFVSKKGYHKLPGGGIEKGESIEDALKRECLEEIGCEIKITGEIGTIIEHRKAFKINQESFCYLAKVVGEKGEPAFMDDEIEEGFLALWVSLDEAIKILETDKSDDYQGKFIKIRDLAFLREI
ncbi:MAG: NUDIX domain-containing protein [Spirochaetia bacterium]|nr:MAG: NUDIX domain-containing protein [Spirochaetia bacterium]